jgi:hypothetical protein
VRVVREARARGPWVRKAAERGRERGNEEGLHPSLLDGPSEELTTLAGLATTAANAEELEVAASILARLLAERLEREGRSPRPPGGRPEGRRGKREPTQTSRTEEARRLQRLFRNNRERAFREVTTGPAPRCEISVGRVWEHFRDVHASRSPVGEMPNLFETREPSAASCASLVEPLRAAVVSGRLRRMKKSSPGPDGAGYADLAAVDPGCHALTALFNACLRLGRMPRGWKNSTTVLLHKKGDRGEIGSWRPISMGDTTARLFAALMADRLTDWAVANGRLSTTQKGFLKYEGCHEHSFVLQEAIRDAKRGGRELVVAWLDLSNAFGSVPHETIRETLRRHMVPAAFRNLVDSAYDGVETRIETAGGITEPIPILSGVRQGCPLSPIVFNLALEPIVRAIAAEGGGYRLEGKEYTNLVYADDAAVLSASPRGMRRLLNKIEVAAASVGLRFNPAKCATLHVTGGKNGKTLPTTFHLQGEVIRALRAGEPYEHLGTPTGFKVRQTPFKSIDELAEDLKAVDRSLLAPWQKLDAAATFILPRLDFCLRGSHVEKGPLTGVDRTLRKMAKRWMFLPRRASAELVYLPPRMGGGGLLPLADMADVLTVAHAFRTLSSKDVEVRALAWASLRRAASGKLGRKASPKDLAAYLSGETEGEYARPTSGPESAWSRARSAARRISRRLALRWRWTEERGELAIECRAPGRATVILPPSARAQTVSRLRAALVEYYGERVLAKKDQGKTLAAAIRSRVSNHFLRTGSFTRFADWRFVHRARLNVLPLNGARRWAPGSDERCRRCGAGRETLPHVLQHCGPGAVARQRRHDAIVERLRVANHAPGTVNINRRVEGARGANTRLRPDIVIRDETNKNITLIDVAVPFENGAAALDEAREEKIRKYHSLGEDLRGAGYKVAVEAFLVGALGAWYPKNERILGMLRVNPVYATWMRRLMVSDTIRWSRDAYVEHVSGVRQFGPAGTDKPPRGDTQVPATAERAPAKPDQHPEPTQINAIDDNSAESARDTADKGENN